MCFAGVRLSLLVELPWRRSAGKAIRARLVTTVGSARVTARICRGQAALLVIIISLSVKSAFLGLVKACGRSGDAGVKLFEGFG
jgi:hypothetical protein